MMSFTFWDTERFIHSVKTTIACVIGFYLSRLIGLPADQWVVISIIVVMCAQIYVGSMAQKSYSRFLGTLLGCLFASVSLIFTHHSTLDIAATIALSSFIFSYIATGQQELSYAGTLGAATTAIILLGSKEPTLTFAAQRFLEISLGILIAGVISQFVFPIHAKTHLRREQAKTLGMLHDYYKNLLADHTQLIEIQELDENIVKSLLKQRQLAKESASEKKGSAFNQLHFTESLYYEREILRAITFMYHGIDTIKQCSHHFVSIPSLSEFNEAVLTCLKQLVTMIENKNSKQQIIIPSVDAVKTDFKKIQPPPSHEEMIAIGGFLFSAEIVVHSLQKLKELSK